MAPEHLIQTATDLAEINPRRPRRADLCRAVSTTYYAMFHCLSHACGQLGRPRRHGWPPVDVAAGIPFAGAQAGQDAVREHAVLVSRRSAGIRASVLGEAVTTPEWKFGARPPP